MFVRRIPTLNLTVVATVVAAICLLIVALSHNLTPMMLAMSVLGFALGLTQTTTMDWVVDLVDDTSRGSALGLRVATDRVGQTSYSARRSRVTVVGSRDGLSMLAVVVFATAEQACSTPGVVVSPPGLSDRRRLRAPAIV